MTISPTPAQRTPLTNLIAPSFYALHNDVKANAHNQYWLCGGRGSTKSSFISLEIILGMMKDAEAGVMSNAVIFRRYMANLRDSVYSQMQWAIDQLGVSEFWQGTLSPLKWVYLPTGQVILFRGADNVKKAKSIKTAKGYIKYLWFEELDEFEGSEKIRSIKQSVIRGGEKFFVFYSYNPPKSMRVWVNDPVESSSQDTIVHQSNYKSVPPDWLGEQFITEAERLREVNLPAYEHEYLGKVTGTGTEVFSNLRACTLSAKELRAFDNRRYGLDWGYATDPFHFTGLHYDRKRRRIYIFDEIQQIRLSNRKSAAMVKKRLPKRAHVLADSAEPKSIDDYREFGIDIKGAKKGAGSIEYGVKWLSEELEEIIIDPERCPRTWREFYGYELNVDSNGEVISKYPDKDNHSIDAVRYALSEDMRNSSARFVNVSL